MVKAGSKDREMKFLLLQESVWNNGDKANRILEHVISQETHLLRLTRLIEMITQRLGILTNGGSS